MTLQTLRDNIVETIDTALVDLRSCEPHPGEFTKEDLKRFFTTMPAVRVAITGLRMVKVYEDRADWSVRCAVVAATDDARSGKRADSVMDLVSGLLTLIPANTWGLANADEPKNIDVENAYSVVSENKGVALYIISWDQALELPLWTAAGASGLDAFVTANMIWNLASPGEDAAAEDNITLPQE